MTTTTTAPYELQRHRQYDADDYSYLRAIGWTDAKILARWDQEAAAGNTPCRWEGEGARGKLNAALRSQA
jgi:protease II